MRKLTDHDLTNIAGSTIHGYHVEGVRIKRGPFTDSDHYGIILGRNSSDQYVTWEFHLDENEKPVTYWGRYTDNHETALRDFNTRDLVGSEVADNGSHSTDGTQDRGLLRKFKVTITETLSMTVTVEAETSEEAEQMVSDEWRNGIHILDAQNFVGVEFETTPVAHGG